MSTAPCLTPRSRGFLVSAGVAALLLVSMAASGLAGESSDPFKVDPATAAALHGVVADQLAALDRGDGKAAEAFATPAIRDKFPEPERFLSMVRENYGALLHAKSTQFTEIVPSPHGPLQKMTVVAADGSVWTAIYSFEQIAGAWRISGCGIQRDNSQQDI